MPESQPPRKHGDEWLGNPANREAATPTPDPEEGHLDDRGEQFVVPGWYTLIVIYLIHLLSKGRAFRKTLLKIEVANLKEKKAQAEISLNWAKVKIGDLRREVERQKQWVRDHRGKEWPERQDTLMTIQMHLEEISVREADGTQLRTNVRRAHRFIIGLEYKLAYRQIRISDLADGELKDIKKLFAETQADADREKVEGEAFSDAGIAPEDLEELEARILGEPETDPEIERGLQELRALQAEQKPPLDETGSATPKDADEHQGDDEAD